MGPNRTVGHSFDTVQVRPVRTVHEARTCGTIFAKAFGNDEYWQWVGLHSVILQMSRESNPINVFQIYTPHIQDAKGKQKEAILQEGLRQSRQTIMNYYFHPKAYVLLAVDKANEEPVGFAVWLAPSTQLGKRYRRNTPLWQRTIWKLHAWYIHCVKLLSKASLHWCLLYPSLGISVMQRQSTWAHHTQAIESRYIQQHNRKQGYWQLSLLGVLPAFSGRGIAKKLLKFGTEKADEDDTVCYLSASPKGLPVYSKFGFGVLGADVCYPEDPQGGWTETFMIRERRSERSTSSKQE